MELRNQNGFNFRPRGSPKTERRPRAKSPRSDRRKQGKSFKGAGEWGGLPYIVSWQTTQMYHDTLMSLNQYETFLSRRKSRSKLPLAFPGESEEEWPLLAAPLGSPPPRLIPCLTLSKRSNLVPRREPLSRVFRNALVIGFWTSPCAASLVRNDGLLGMRPFRLGGRNGP